MGFSSQNKKGQISEINVTPLVDVMLVLLVIFMVTAPMMFSGINLKLPKAKKVNNLVLDSKQVILSINSAGEFYLGKNKILPEELLSEVKKQFEVNATDVVFVRADYSLRYGMVAKLMSQLKNAGIQNISLVTEIEK